ncbi:MAG: hypothetical protein MUO88_02535 [Desulfobacterales bacterium]|nr:hypothetical protein [Desulfobacterales bacterium]
MPITSKVDKRRNLTTYALTGELTLDDIQSTLKAFWEAHELTLNTLWDARNAKLTNLESSDMERITALIGQYTHRFEERKGGKSAVVASSDLQYGLSRILGTLYEVEDFPTQLKIFRIKDEAVEWLDQDE